MTIRKERVRYHAKVIAFNLIESKIIFCGGESVFQKSMGFWYVIKAVEDTIDLIRKISPAQSRLIDADELVKELADCFGVELRKCDCGAYSTVEDLGKLYCRDCFAKFVAESLDDEED